MSTRILQGDCREVLATLPDASVHCVVTSPPYWGLRDYGVDGQIGLEQSPAEYVAQMVAVFREVWRVLRDDGTVWLNLGDSFASSGGRSAQGESSARVGRANVEVQNAQRGFRPGLQCDGIKSGDLVGIPWMVAFALRDAGWWLRQDNIWAKRNCMPESVRNRTTRAHEYVFQLTKSGDPLFWTHRELPGARSKPEPDYRWVHKETKEEVEVDPGDAKLWRRINLWSGNDYFYDAVAIEEDGEIAAGTRAAKGSEVRSALKDVNGRPPEYYEYTGRRNKRSVWWMATQPFPEAHFATFPPELPEICIKAGTSERGCCAACGSPWVRQTEKAASGRTRDRSDAGLGVTESRAPHGLEAVSGKFQEGVQYRTIGWLPSCSCDADEPVPCAVLGPFAGAFTTALVADRLGRNCIGIELNESYCEMARRRIEQDAGMFAQVAAQ